MPQSHRIVRAGGDLGSHLAPSPLPRAATPGTRPGGLGPRLASRTSRDGHFGVWKAGAAGLLSAIAWTLSLPGGPQHVGEELVFQEQLRAHSRGTLVWRRLEQGLTLGTAAALPEELVCTQESLTLNLLPHFKPTSSTPRPEKCSSPLLKIHLLCLTLLASAMLQPSACRAMWVRGGRGCDLEVALAGPTEVPGAVTPAELLFSEDSLLLPQRMAAL